MAVPARRVSHTRKAKRQTGKGLESSAIVKCPKCGEEIRPHRVCTKCGNYKGKDVVTKETKTEETAA